MNLVPALVIGAAVYAASLAADGTMTVRGIAAGGFEDPTSYLGYMFGRKPSPKQVLIYNLVEFGILTGLATLFVFAHLNWGLTGLLVGGQYGSAIAHFGGANTWRKWLRAKG